MKQNLCVLNNIKEEESDNNDNLGVWFRLYLKLLLMRISK
jgi:hypothetical protein